MKQIEKDLLLLGSVGSFAKGLDMKIQDIIPEFNRDKVIQLAESLSINETDENTINALKEAASQIYKRVEKKFIT